MLDNKKTASDVDKMFINDKFKVIFEKIKDSRIDYKNIEWLNMIYDHHPYINHENIRTIIIKNFKSSTVRFIVSDKDDMIEKVVEYTSNDKNNHRIDAMLNALVLYILND